VNIQVKDFKVLRCFRDSHEYIRVVKMYVESEVFVYFYTVMKTAVEPYHLTIIPFVYVRLLPSCQLLYCISCSKVLSAELDGAKQKLSTCEAERAAKCKQEHTIDAEIEDLLKQKYEFEDKLKDLSVKLEDTRNKHEFSIQGVANLRTMLEKIWYV
jgi:septal ring factor EnvC (AmiA/AmiB activator)